MAVLVTGGSGFLGTLLVERLLRDGHRVVSLDLVPSDARHPNLVAVMGDIRDRALLDHVFAEHPVDGIFHLAALLAHGAVPPAELWSANVDGTRVLAEAAVAAGAPHLVFTSSNCLWGEIQGRSVRGDDAPRPAELYGRSKWEGERVLADFADRLPATIIRCPTILEEGRLGLLSILFEFIAEGRRVWVVGDGSNRYQFVYAPDLVEAMILAWQAKSRATYGIGSDDVRTMRDCYEHVIRVAGSGARVASLPKGPTLAAMRAAHALRISPLGPYHYRMIASDFVFDTTRIKAELGWRPTLSNHAMLARAYGYYAANRAAIHARRNVSAHRKPAAMGVIRVLKWVS